MKCKAAYTYFACTVLETIFTANQSCRGAVQEQTALADLREFDLH